MMSTRNWIKLVFIKTVLPVFKNNLNSWTQTNKTKQRLKWKVNKHIINNWIKECDGNWWRSQVWFVISLSYLEKKRKKTLVFELLFFYQIKEEYMYIDISHSYTFAMTLLCNVFGKCEIIFLISFSTGI